MPEEVLVKFIINTLILDAPPERKPSIQKDIPPWVSLISRNHEIQNKIIDKP